MGFTGMEHSLEWTWHSGRGIACVWAQGQGATGFFCARYEQSLRLTQEYCNPRKSTEQMQGL